MYLQEPGTKVEQQGHILKFAWGAHVRGGDCQFCHESSYSTAFYKHALCVLETMHKAMSCSLQSTQNTTHYEL